MQRMDPFAERSGKHLSFQNVNMVVSMTSRRDHNGNHDQEGLQVLQNVYGEVPEHKIVAIMGPSGSGKTSLLNILSGRSRSKGHVFIESDGM